MRITKSNEPTCKDYILCDSNHMTFWKRQSYEDSKNVSACKELEGREGGMGKHRGSLGQ